MLKTGRRIRRCTHLGALVGVFAAVSCAVMIPACDETAPQSLARTAFHRGAGEPLIRVRIARSIAEVDLQPRSRILVLDAANPSRIIASVAGPSAIRVENGAFILQDARGARAVDVPPVAILREADGGPVVFAEGDHHGDLEISIGSDGDALNVIEIVPLERYVAGVIARELYPGWSPATYESQAITARTYALHERNRRIGVGSRFHVESTTRDQAYEGATESTRALDAVRRTQGMVLTFRGDILRTYYSSTCGGRAASARDTWPTGAGFEYNLHVPIQAHERECPCGFSSRYRWVIDRPLSEFTKRLAAHGARTGASIRSIKSLAKIEAHRFNRVDRPAAFKITDRRGKTWVLSGEQFRLACNVAASGAREITKNNRVWSSDVEVSIDGQTVRITGRGYGHGVGMCQFGAEGLARDGRTAPEILSTYYPGATLERAY